MRTVIAAIGLLSVCAAGGAAPTAHVAHLELSVTLDPATRRFAAVAEFIARAGYRFMLHESLEVRAMRIDGRGSGIPAPTPVAGGREWHLANKSGARLRIEYGGTLPPLDRELDHRGVLRIAAPMASAEGSFLPAGRGWYPEPGGLFTYSVDLNLPPGQLGLVPGRLVKETTRTGKSYAARFEFVRPAEGIDLMAGPYVIRERIVERSPEGPLRLRTYFYPALENLADDYLADSRRYIGLYASRIGAYPYSEFSVVASPLPVGFGMPTLTYLGADVLKLPFIRATSLGHEVLHNWWGNGVYPDYAAGNWSEGLTTYMADYYYKERESAAAARDMRVGWLRDFAAVAEERRQPLASFRSRTHGAAAAVGYGKSAMVFHMLRGEVGDAAFEQALRAFWERHRFQTASWDDLRAAFEAAAGRNLGDFFTQWLQRSGAPRLNLRDATARHADGRTTLQVTVEQRDPPYRLLRVPLQVSAGGKTAMHTITVERTRQTLTLEVDALPDTVRLDPDIDLWRELDAAELPLILRLWFLATAPSYLVASPDAAVQRLAAELAPRLFETLPQRLSGNASSHSNGPLLIIGLHTDVDAALARLKLPPRPAAVRELGSAAVWTIAQFAGARTLSAPVAVISAQDASALEALRQPLPHYGAQSYVVFDGPRALRRGVWPAEAPALAVRKLD